MGTCAHGLRLTLVAPRGFKQAHPRLELGLFTPFRTFFVPYTTLLSLTVWPPGASEATPLRLRMRMKSVRAVPLFQSLVSPSIGIARP